jgi:hypothetical protein
VATALAIVALGAATALAIPGLSVVSVAVATIVLAVSPHGTDRVAALGRDFLRHADRVLELRDGTVIEWERRTADARLH